MEEWIEAGCRLAFLIDPVARKARVYRSDGSVTEYSYTSAPSAEDILKGFALCPAQIGPED